MTRANRRAIKQCDYRYGELIRQAENWMRKLYENGRRKEYRRMFKLKQYLIRRHWEELTRTDTE